MNICGVLVHVSRARTDEVERALAAVPGVDLHGGADGRLVITIEDQASASAADSLRQIQLLPGVVTAALVYHHFEPDQETGADDQEIGQP